MRKSCVPCLCCGQPGVPGLIAALNVAEGSSPGLDPVRMGTPALDVQWYRRALNKIRCLWEEICRKIQIT